MTLTGHLATVAVAVLAAALAPPPRALAAPRGGGQGCSSPTPSAAAVDTCAPFALPTIEPRTTPEYRPPAAPKPLFLPPVVDSARPAAADGARSAASLKAGMSYAAARAALEAQGFRPAASGRDTGDRCGPAGEICRDFPEVHACSGMSVIACEFVFERPGGEALVVTTTGTRSRDLVTRSLQRASALDLARHKVGR